MCVCMFVRVCVEFVFFFLGYGRKTYRFIPEDLCDSAGSPRSEASTSSRVADPGDCWSGGREKVGTIAAADVGDEAVVVGPWSWCLGGRIRNDRFFVDDFFCSFAAQNRGRFERVVRSIEAWLKGILIGT